MWCHSRKPCLYSVLFCSVTKIYFWHFKTYLVNVFGNADDSIEYRKMLQTFFCKRRVESTHVSATLHSVYWNAGITFDFCATAAAAAFAELWFIVRGSLIALFVISQNAQVSVVCDKKKPTRLLFWLNPCYEIKDSFFTVF